MDSHKRDTESFVLEQSKCDTIRSMLVSHCQDNINEKLINRSCNSCYYSLSYLRLTVNMKYNVAMESSRWVAVFFSLYLFILANQQHNRLPNELLAVPVFNVPINLQSAITGWLWYWGKLKIWWISGKFWSYMECLKADLWTFICKNDFPMKSKSRQIYIFLTELWLREGVLLQFAARVSLHIPRPSEALCHTDS